MFVDHWVPAARSCPADADALKIVLREARRSCLARATAPDALGTDHVRSLVYTACLEHAGWTRTRRAEKRAWLARCEVGGAGREGIELVKR